MNADLNYLVNEALNSGGKCLDIHSHLITLHAITVSMKAKKVLELGTRDGCSTLSFLLGVKSTNGILISVDLNDVSFGCPDEFKKFWKFIKSDSIAYLSSLPNDIIFDIVFVDDWHATLHVKKELELLERHVTKSSIILLHDLMTRSAPDYNIKCEGVFFNKEQWEGGGPCKAVFELDSDKWEFATIPICNGLTILRKKI